MKLNPNQEIAAKHIDGPALVVAGAGTGKTSVVTERIARLVANGVAKSEILALTFTEKATQEMLDRVSERLDNSYGVELNIFTFNGFGQELLREFAVEIGLSPNLKLIGDTGKAVLLREHLDDLELEYFSPVSNPAGQLGNLADYFSQLKQQLVTPEGYQKYADSLKPRDDAESLEKKRQQELAQAFATYIKLTRSQNIIDYDDQIYIAVEMLEKRPNVLAKLHGRFKYIMVDEFQDTNPMQSKLLDLLASKNNNLMAVGDDDQSIYGWRGATLSNILDFNKRFPNATEITLVDNYRSTQNILDAAYTLIQENNPYRLESLNNLDKKLKSHAGAGSVPIVKHFSSLDIELDWIAEDIERRLKAGEAPESIAVLSRRGKATVNKIHNALELRGVEHTVVGMSTNLYDQPIVATMTETLKAVIDKDDNQANYHALGGELFKLNPSMLSEATAKASKQHLSLLDVLAESEDETTIEALKLLDSWRQLVHELSVGQLSFRIISETGLKDRVIDRVEDSEADAIIAQSLFQWFASLKNFEEASSVSSTLNYLNSLDVIAAEGELLNDDSGQASPSLPVVMTVHKSKGLEWETVYIADCTQGSFPIRKRSSSLTVPEELTKTSAADDHYNEERRLMYVAATRARGELILSYSDKHSTPTKRKPSQFLAEMFGDTEESATIEGDQQTSFDFFGSSAKSGSEDPLLPVPSSMLSGNNLVLTTSQMETYMNCGLDFYYRYIINVPEGSSSAAGVGSLIHDFIQELNEAKMADEPLPKLAGYLEQLKTEWPKEGYPSAKQRQRALDLGLSSFEETYARLADLPAPIATEQPFRVHLPESRLILAGRIDAVMPHSDDGVEVVDYKTSAGVTTPEKAKSRASASHQLSMYALAWNATHSEIPTLVSLDFVQTGQIGSIKKQAKTIQNLEKKLAQNAEDILSGNFKPGYRHDYCKHPKRD